MPGPAAHHTVVEIAMLALANDSFFDFLWTPSGDEWSASMTVKKNGVYMSPTKFVTAAAMGPDYGLMSGSPGGIDKHASFVGELDHYGPTGFIAHKLLEGCYHMYGPGRGADCYDQVDRVAELYKETGANCPFTGTRHSIPRTPLRDARAFAYGWCAHIAADIQVHPFISTLIGEYRGYKVGGHRHESHGVVKNAIEHQRCDMALDVFTYQRYHKGSHPHSHESRTGYKAVHANHDFPEAETPYTEVNWETPQFMRYLLRYAWDHGASVRIPEQVVENMHDGASVAFSLLTGSLSGTGYYHKSFMGLKPRLPVSVPEFYLTNPDGVPAAWPVERAVKTCIHFWLELKKLEQAGTLQRVPSTQEEPATPLCDMFNEYNLDVGYYVDKKASWQKGYPVIRHAWNMEFPAAVETAFNSLRSMDRNTWDLDRFPLTPDGSGNVSTVADSGATGG